MAKTIVDAILGLSFDDSPSNLAAATLFCVLTSDVSDKESMCESTIVEKFCLANWWKDDNSPNEEKFVQMIKVLFWLIAFSVVFFEYGYKIRF